MSVDIGTFLSRKGSIPLIYALARENGRIVAELKDELEATDQTVTDRINEARENKLIELKYDPSDHGNAKRYVLTGRGLELYIYMKENDAYDIYEQYLEVKQEYEETKDALEEWGKEKDAYWRDHMQGDPDWEKIEWVDRPLDSEDQ